MVKKLVVLNSYADIKFYENGQFYFQNTNLNLWNEPLVCG